MLWDSTSFSDCTCAREFAASMLLRSLSAVSRSLASKPIVAVLVMFGLAFALVILNFSEFAQYAARKIAKPVRAAKHRLLCRHRVQVI